MMRADLLVGPKTDTGKRMSFKEKEKEKKIYPHGMMKGMISQLAWQRQGHHNLPTRWSEPKGGLSFSAHLLTLDRQGWREMEDGLLTQRPRQAWDLDFVSRSASLLWQLPRGGDCYLQAFVFCPSPILHGIGGVAREMGQSKRAGIPGWRAAYKIAIWDSVRVS